jgi:cation diffusion facilitator CzcD-associated flavoprotein CzcO
MGYRLKEAGFNDFVILDRAEGIGGAWWSNTYPGCQCDIPSQLYSLSFAPNPRWTRTFPLQAEIQAYLRRCAEDFELISHLRLRHEVLSADWDGEQACWSINTSQGLIRARVLVGAHGGLSEPRLPDIPGRESFGGSSFHSARWDNTQDLRGKRVAVLGTGASAIQIVPSIQPLVGQLHVFQRTPPWILPHTDRATSRVERAIYSRCPALMRVPRALAYCTRELASPGFTRFPRLLTPLELRSKRHLAKQVKSRHLRRQLTPRYRIGCKRILPTNRWYPVLQQPNVEVVCEAVAEVTPEGIRTAAGRHIDLDVIIYATGFEATEPPIARLIKGERGQSLASIWDGSPRAYRNTTVPGFPNLFLISGLNTGYSSMVYMIEAQLRYVVHALEWMRKSGWEALDVKSGAFDTWNSWMERRLRRAVWSAGGCSSWYIDRNGRSTTVWPDFTWRFRWLTRQFDPDSYRSKSAGHELQRDE